MEEKIQLEKQLAVEVKIAKENSDPIMNTLPSMGAVVIGKKGDESGYISMVQEFALPDAERAALEAMLPIKDQKVSNRDKFLFSSYIVILNVNYPNS
jgi:hypothetical protein